MRNRIAKFVPVIALSVFAAGCADQVTQPGDSAGMMPIDTMYSGQRAPIDTLMAMPVDTLMAMPVDTLMAMPVDTLM